MKIISQTKDFRNWDEFVVKGDAKEIEDYFTKKYPNNDVSVMEYMNHRGTFEVGILPIEEDED